MKRLVVAVGILLLATTSLRAHHSYAGFFDPQERREVRKVRARLGRDVFRREAFRQLVVAARLVVEEFANAKRFHRSR
jgi:hypothetical protein